MFIKSLGEKYIFKESFYEKNNDKLKYSRSISAYFNSLQTSCLVRCIPTLAKVHIIPCKSIQPVLSLVKKL